MKLYCSDSDILVAENLKAAKDPLSRLKGLLFTKELKKGCGLWLKDCNSIHTFFMRYAIDVLFTDRNLRVVKIIPSMLPNRISPIVFKAHSVIELPAGTLVQTPIRIADQLEIKPD